MKIDLKEAAASNESENICAKRVAFLLSRVAQLPNASTTPSAAEIFPSRITNLSDNTDACEGIVYR